MVRVILAVRAIAAVVLSPILALFKMALTGSTVLSVQSLVLFAFLIKNCSLNLMVNIKAKDGEIEQQIFVADPEKDYVTIDFKNNEGRRSLIVTVFIDFRLVSFSCAMAF